MVFALLRFTTPPLTVAAPSVADGPAVALPPLAVSIVKSPPVALRMAAAETWALPTVPPLTVAAPPLAVRTPILPPLRLNTPLFMVAAPTLVEPSPRLTLPWLSDRMPLGITAPRRRRRRH